MAQETAPAEKTMTAKDLMNMAEMYHVPMSEGTVKQIAGESVTPEKASAFEEYVKTAAQGLYPTLAPQIKAGIPTAYLLDPYRQIAKQKLGDDFEPNFQSDPKATAALTGGTDPQTGRPVPMSLDQWKQHIMTEPSFGYDKTPEAIDRARQVVQSMQAGFERPKGAM
jgi:hypothetical protein